MCLWPQFEQRVLPLSTCNSQSVIAFLVNDGFSGPHKHTQIPPFILAKIKSVLKGIPEHQHFGPGFYSN